jgi:hypothetical protein
MTLFHQKTYLAGHLHSCRTRALQPYMGNELVGTFHGTTADAIAASVSLSIIEIYDALFSLLQSN